NSRAPGPPPPAETRRTPRRPSAPPRSRPTDPSNTATAPPHRSARPTPSPVTAKGRSALRTLSLRPAELTRRVECVKSGSPGTTRVDSRASRGGRGVRERNAPRDRQGTESAAGCRLARAGGLARRGRSPGGGKPAAAPARRPGELPRLAGGHRLRSQVRL